MIFPNWTVWKTLKTVLFVAGGFVPLLPATYQTQASALIAAVGTVVVTLSGTAVGPTIGPKVAP